MKASQLIQFRSAIGLTQQQLAEKTFRSQNTISQYELGIREVNGEAEKQLLNALHVVKSTFYYQLTTEQILNITRQLFEDGTSYWNDGVLIKNAPLSKLDRTKYGSEFDHYDDEHFTLLEGGTLLFTYSDEREKNDLGMFTLTMEKLLRGLEMYLENSRIYVPEYVINYEDEFEEWKFDEIAVNEIMQYAIFGAPLCDLTDQGILPHDWLNR